MLLNPFKLYRPKSLSDAADLLKSLENIRLQAGGTFLINNLKLLKRKGVKTPDHIISLRNISDLKGISKKGDRILIGAMTTMNELLNSSALTGNSEILKTAAYQIGTSQIRNMATIGGNLTCRYTWTEMPAIMIGLEATLHFATPKGKTEEISAEEFFSAGARSQNILTHISIKDNPTSLLAYRRVKKSPHLDIPLLSVFVKTEPDGDKFKNTRVVVNNTVAFAQRDKTAEDFINKSGRSKTISEEIPEHLDNTIYETRSSAYKKHMFRITMRDALRELVEK